MSSDDGCEESDASTDDGLPFEAVVNSTESNSLAKSCRELDRKRLRNLCEFGKVLYGQIHSTAIETRRNESRNSLWNSRSDLNSSVDSSLKSSLNCFTEICYLQTFKIMADWLRYAGEDMEFFEKVNIHIHINSGKGRFELIFLFERFFINRKMSLLWQVRL